MPQVKKMSKKTQTQNTLASFLESKPHSNSVMLNYKNRHATESRIPFSKNSKKQRFLLLKLKGLGCKWTSPPPVSTPALIRTAAEWESKGSRNKNQKKREALNKQRNTANVAVDVPHVCCTPPGIGIASDFAPRNRNPAPRFHHRKHPREARRNEEDSAANLSGGVGSRTNHRSAEEILEILMSRQTLLPGRIQDRHHDWRLNVDDMSYEELLDLSDRIGYVGTGLQEEEIAACLRKLKHINNDSASLLIAAHKDWKCSICQEKFRRDDDIGTLKCGHNHHVECIKQWLLHKNTCPVCKSAAMRNTSV